MKRDFLMLVRKTSDTWVRHSSPPSTSHDVIQMQNHQQTLPDWHLEDAGSLPPLVGSTRSIFRSLLALMPLLRQILMWCQSPNSSTALLRPKLIFYFETFHNVSSTWCLCTQEDSWICKTLCLIHFVGFICRRIFLCSSNLQNEK